MLHRVLSLDVVAGDGLKSTCQRSGNTSLLPQPLFSNVSRPKFPAQRLGWRRALARLQSRDRDGSRRDTHGIPRLWKEVPLHLQTARRGDR